MESSRRFLLQAEIEYWHEMLRLNKSRVSKTKEEEMRDWARHLTASRLPALPPASSLHPESCVESALAAMDPG
jgi:hypothetical protein